MKVKTLLKAMIYPVETVELYEADFKLIGSMDIEEFQDHYSESRIDMFNIYESEEGNNILEVFLK